jgi:hypothetical protein
VTFGGLDAELDLRFSGGQSFVNPTTTGQTSVTTSVLDVISGLVTGDHIVLPSLGETLATAPNLAGIADQAVFATGTYDAAAETFTEGSGRDALLTIDSHGSGGTGFFSVVLVGAAHEIAGSTIHVGTITMG